jgi:Tfp pilus assembly protein PilO
MNLKKNELLLLYTIGGLLAVLIMPRAIFGPFASKLSGLTRDVALGEARLKKSVSLAAGKEIINKEYEKYATYFSLQGLSDEEAVGNFLKEIERISRVTGLAILDMKPQKETKADKFSKQYQISIKAEGAMQQLVSFLHELQGSPVLFSVEKMTLVPKQEDSPQLSIALTIVGVSFL